MTSLTLVNSANITGRLGLAKLLDGGVEIGNITDN